MQTNRRPDLTPEDIASLSVEMRCCYFICPWNSTVDITTPEDWAADHGFARYYVGETTFDESVLIAMQTVSALTEFVKDVVADKDVIIRCLESDMNTNFEDMDDAHERYMAAPPE